MEMNENGALQQQVYLAITYIFAPKVGATSKIMSSQFLPGALNGYEGSTHFSASKRNLMFGLRSFQNFTVACGNHQNGCF